MSKRKQRRRAQEKISQGGINPAILGEPAAIANAKSIAKKAAQEHLNRGIARGFDDPSKLFIDSIDAGIATIDPANLAQSTGFLAMVMPDSLDQARKSAHAAGANTAKAISERITPEQAAELAKAMGLPAKTMADIAGMAIGMIQGCDAAIDRYVEVLLTLGEALVRGVDEKAREKLRES